ncbi:MAG TPA: efflux RND transporter periplasmic adaptor subunit [Acidobacteriaceae bacterium]|nr:efflux RND transporter periplasmic adaptor subunit [Acidobacteriaceae bacterium]
MKILRSSKAWKGTVAAAAVIGLAMAYKHWSDPAAPEVICVSPESRDLTVSVSAPGQVIPVNDFQAHANFTGTVEQIYVQVGERVHSGQMLVVMKDPYAASRVATAEANLKTSELSDSNIRNGGSQEDQIGMSSDFDHAQQEEAAAQNSLATLKRLQADGAASGAEVAAAEQRLQTATVTLNTIDSRIHHRYSAQEVQSWGAQVMQARAVLAAEEKNYGNAYIRSPIEGTVYLAPVTPYQFVQAGQDLVRVADLRMLEVRASFDEADIGRITNGEPATITWDGRPRRVWHGHVEHPPLAAMIAGDRSVGDCIISVDDANGDLLPDTGVTVAVITDRRPKAFSIPRGALHTEEDGGFFVYRVRDGMLVRTPVTAGLLTLQYAQIVHGLSANDLVAVRRTDDQEMDNHLAVRAIK